MTAPGEKKPLSHQTTLAVSNVLTLLGRSDVLTILVFSRIEQLLVIMRIAGYRSYALTELAICGCSHDDLKKGCSDHSPSLSSDASFD